MIWNRIKSILKKVWYRLMARPRVLHVENGGEILLRNIDKEKADKIIAILTNRAITQEVLLQQEEKKEQVIEVDESLNEKAFGMTKNSDGQWCVVELNYNLESKQGSVANITNHGASGKYVASDDLRVKIGSNFL